MFSMLEVQVDSLLVNKMLLWPSSGDLKADTESEIVAAQDQALQIRSCNKNITNRERNVVKKVPKKIPKYKDLTVEI